MNRVIALCFIFWPLVAAFALVGYLAGDWAYAACTTALAIVAVASIELGSYIIKKENEL